MPSTQPPRVAIRVAPFPYPAAAAGWTPRRLIGTLLVSWGGGRGDHRRGRSRDPLGLATLTVVPSFQVRRPGALHAGFLPLEWRRAS